MFGVVAGLAALARASHERAEAVMAFFAPALDWIQRWLPLFYVPSLIMLPLALRDIAGAAPWPAVSLHASAVRGRYAAVCKQAMRD
jgi:hypothetical protein